MIWLGASSPPSVWPVPEKRETGLADESPSDRLMFLRPHQFQGAPHARTSQNTLPSGLLQNVSDLSSWVSRILNREPGLLAASKEVLPFFVILLLLIVMSMPLSMSMPVPTSLRVTLLPVQIPQRRESLFCPLLSTRRR